MGWVDSQNLCKHFYYIDLVRLNLSGNQFKCDCVGESSGFQNMGGDLCRISKGAIGHHIDIVGCLLLQSS